MGLRGDLTRALLRLETRWLRERSAARLFWMLAERFGVEEVVARGELGRVEGKIDDPIVFGRYLRSGRWSPHLVQFLEACFAGAQSGTFIDIGANIGLISLAVSRLGHVDCLCFEPEPENMALLRRNLERNGVEHAQLFPIALHSEETRLSFELSAVNRGDHRIRMGPSAEGAAPEDADRTVIEVEARPLDAVLAGSSLKQPIVVKSDAQGAEVAIWEGARETCARADAMVIEFWPQGIERMGHTVERLLDQVESVFERAALVRSQDDLPLPAAVPPVAGLREQVRAFRAETDPGAHADLVLVREAFLTSLLP